MKYVCAISAILCSLLLGHCSTCNCFASDAADKGSLVVKEGTSTESEAFPDPQRYKVIVQSGEKLSFDISSKLLQRGRSYADRGMYGPAEELLTTYIPLTPSQVGKQELIETLAEVLVAEGKYSDAERVLKQAASDSNGWEPAQVGDAFAALGDYYLKRERFTDAALAYKRAVDMQELCDELGIAHTSRFSIRDVFHKYTYTLWKTNLGQLLTVSLAGAARSFLGAAYLPIFLGLGFVFWLVKSALGFHLLKRICTAHSKKWCFITGLWIFGLSASFTLGMLLAFKNDHFPSMGPGLVAAMLLFCVCPIVEISYLSFVLKRFLGALQTSLFFLMNFLAFGVSMGFYSMAFGFINWVWLICAPFFKWGPPHR